MKKDERIATLKKIKGESESRKTFPVWYKDKKEDLSVYRVDISLPLYRTNNGRTTVDQYQYISENSLDEYFFLEPEDEDAQKAQEKLLLSLVDKNDLEVDLKEYEQQDPLVITYDGIVLNGNRRLAALRRLNKEYVDCVILPQDADQKDMLRIEMSFQMQRETKLEYDWISELLTIRRGTNELGMSAADVAKQMKTKQTHVQKKLQTLDFIDQYLEYIKKPNQYHLLRNTEQAFNDISKHIEKIPPEYRETILHVIFEKINEKKPRGRKYDYINTILKNPTEFIKEAQEEGLIELKPLNKTVKGDPIFGRTPQADVSKTTVLEPPSDDESKVEKITKIAGRLKTKMDLETENRAKIEGLSKAHESLASVKIDKEVNIDQVAATLKSIMREINRIRSDIGDIFGTVENTD